MINTPQKLVYCNFGDGCGSCCGALGSTSRQRLNGSNRRPPERNATAAAAAAAADATANDDVLNAIHHMCVLYLYNMRRHGFTACICFVSVCMLESVRLKYSIQNVYCIVYIICARNPACLLAHSSEMCVNMYVRVSPFECIYDDYRIVHIIFG